jgi:hypothetical protein
MKKLLVPLAVMLLLALAVPAAFADVELGIGWTPYTNPDASATDPNKNDSITGFHVAYSWFILYGSWDALALPASFIERATTFTEPDTGIHHDGIALPGFLNLYDVGIQLTFRPIVAYAEIGINSLYIYGGETFDRVGANLRLGAGVRFGFWGVNLSGTAIFATMEDLTSVLKGLGSESTRSWAVRSIGESLVPSLNLTFYF